MQLRYGTSMAGARAERISQLINKLPKWAHDYIHQVHTFVGPQEVDELKEAVDRRGFAERRTVQDFGHRALRISTLKAITRQARYRFTPL